MIFGYIRISDKSQNEDRQIREFKKNGADKIIIEKKSGAKFEDREEFKKLFSQLREDDYLMVEAIDRLGRNYSELIETINDLKRKKVGLLVTSLPLLSKPLGDPLIDAFVKDLIIQVLAMNAERERTEMKRRQKQGIEIAKKKGIYRGSPKQYSETAKNPQKRLVYNQIVDMLSKGISKSEIAKKTGTGRSTVYRISKEIE